jgi:hypothetical protein
MESLAAEAQRSALRLVERSSGRTLMIVLILHPGDLSFWELAGIVGVFFALAVLPILVIGFIIYEVTRKHSSNASEGDHVTLGLSDSEKSPE